ncbi:MAG: hypothetical protein HYV97_20030 [Bdellovibrio sp.]|nr:hypothetical protein [Bdellovibrio sp.]
MAYEFRQEKLKTYILIASIFLLGAIILGQQLQHQNSNTAVKVKNLLSKQNKSPFKPWQQLIRTNRNVTRNDSATLLAPSGRALATNDVSELIIAEQSIEELADYINTNMANIDRYDLPLIEKNIEAAEIIIARVPDSYSAYKAKLISLLIKEAKFNQEIDDYEINGLLESMATFDFPRDTQTVKETILLVSSNNEIAQLNDKLGEVNLEKEEIESVYEAFDITTAEARVLEALHARLLIEEEELLEQIVLLERNASEMESGPGIINEDLVHIPFLRTLARNDFDQLISDAQDFIDQFPGSPIGYLYLVKALSMQGREEEALTAILNSSLSKDSLTQIQVRLEKLEELNPKYYWKMLKF